MTARENYVEPWLRETHTDLGFVERAVLHALEMAQEDVTLAITGLMDEQWRSRPGGVSSISFHVLHIAGSLDRLLTYAEGNALSDTQREFAQSETRSEMSPQQCMDTFTYAIEQSKARIAVLCAGSLETPAFVGSKRLPTTVGALLIHAAEHTSRHVGQVVTTAQIVRASR